MVEEWRKNYVGEYKEGFQFLVRRNIIDGLSFGGVIQSNYAAARSVYGMNGSDGHQERY
jgi:hypothetical protein